MTSVNTPRYRILETIGKGGMGEVCLADDLVLDRRVALKFLVSSPDDDGDVVIRLLREARAAAALDHPFICKIYEVTELERRPCIVMEYVAGETIERRLRAGPIAIPEGLRLAEEIAEALEAAHKRRLVHRDLKPANVIVTEDDHIKVMDFGLAARLPMAGHAIDVDATVDGSSGSGVLQGTPAYMSPEQVRGAPVDRRSDIFAFGILLYEMFSGHHPFRRRGLEATLSAVLEVTPDHLHRQAPWVPEGVGLMVARMLTKDPGLRHQSFAEVRLELRRLSGDLASSGTWVAKPLAGDSPADDARPFVPREAEQAELVRSLRRAREGRGGLILLTGEAGAGKTRLAQEALNEARRLGFLSLTGRCSEQEADQPLIPYIEVLEESARLLPVPVLREALGRAAPELARLVPELHRLFDELQEPLELPPDMQQRFLFTNIRDFLARCAKVSPLVIFLDDLQWADESTVQLTQHLAPHLDKMPVVVIAAYREVQTPAKAQPRGLGYAVAQVLQRVRGWDAEGQSRSYPLTRAVVEQLVGQRLARLVQVGLMTEPKVGALLSALGRADPPASLVKRFFEATGGNPFFVEELFQHLKEEQKLFTSQGGWRRDLAVDDIDAPAGVRIVISRRLERVSAKTASVLAAAAVIGPHFDLDVLEAVADVDGPGLAAGLEQAEQAHLVRGPSGRQERRWRFEHQMIRQTLASQLPQQKRLKLHLRIADALDRLSRTSTTYASDVAHHLYHAGVLAESSRTARALIAAGDAASEVYATNEAVRHYRRALEILEETNGLERERSNVEERLADLLTLVGDRASALEHYRHLGVLYEKCHDLVGFARSVRKTGMLHWQGGERMQAVECYQRALGTLQGQKAEVEFAHVCQELGLAAFRNGENQKAIEWADRALASAEAAIAAANGDGSLVKRQAAAAQAHANNTIGVSLARLGQLDAARERIERSVTLAQEHGLLDVACRGYANLGVLYASVEPRKAIEASHSGLDLATKIGAATMQPYMYANLAAAYCALTDRCETEGLNAARTAVSLDRELGQLDHLAVPLIVLAQIHQCHGELQQALDAYREALTFAERTGEPQLLFPCYDGLAMVYLDRGDTRLAEQYLAKAKDVCERAGVDPESLLVLPFLC